MDNDGGGFAPIGNPNGVETATVPDDPKDLKKLVGIKDQQLRLKDHQLRLDDRQLRLHEQNLRIQKQQLKAAKDDANLWKNHLALKDRQMRGQDDEMKTMQYELEYLRETKKVLQHQLDENKKSMSDTTSDDGSDGIFVHRSKGELEVKIDELETKVEKLITQNRELEQENVGKDGQIQKLATEKRHLEQESAGKDGRIEKLQRDRDYYESEALLLFAKGEKAKMELVEQCRVHEHEIRCLRYALVDAQHRGRSWSEHLKSEKNF